MSRYQVVLYSSLIIFTNGDLGPVNSIEMLFLSCCMIVSLVINSLILGEVLNLVIIIYKRETNYQEKLDSTNSLMVSH